MKVCLFSKVFGLGAMIAAVGVAGWACSAPDPGDLGETDPGKKPSGNTKFDAGTGGTDAGSTGGNDAGGPQTSNDPFAGADPYQSKTPDQSTKRSGHNQFPDQNPAGENCFTCHASGASAGAPTFWLGGTAYTKKDGVPVGPGVEVRVRSSDGTYSKSVYTDDFGNFWLRSDSGGSFPQVNIGVRAADQTQKMSTQIGSATGGCSASGTCHGGSQGKVFLSQ